MNKDITLSKKQKKNLKLYKIGNTINVSTISYSKMHQTYIDNLNLIKKNKYRTFTAVNDSHSKPNRPVLVLWNHESSNIMLLTSMTTRKHKYLNYMINKNSYVNYEILIFNKKRDKIRYDGLIFETLSRKEMNNYFDSLKEQRPKTFYYYLDLKNKYLEKAILKNGEDLKNK